jgi:hypothetical protein
MRTAWIEQTTMWLVPVVGRIAHIEQDGVVLVDFPGNERGLTRARLIAGGCFERIGKEVLLVFENGDPGLPIILGIVQDRLATPAPVQNEPSRKTFIEAAEELHLSCGKSSIKLERDGQITIRGAKILSRASQSNKIRGASVEIN